MSDSYYFDNYYYDILIVGDSRTRGLEYSLNSTSLNLRFTVFTLPGASLNTIMLKALTSLSYSNTYQLVLLIGGINNMTRLLYNPTRHAVPRFRSTVDLVEHTLSAMRITIDKISAITNMPVVLASLPGMDLAAYSPDYRDLLLPLQDSIDNAITEINLRIRGINRLNNLQTLNLAYPVHRCKGRNGRYRTQYSLLFDGLHPNTYLQARWVNAIIDYCAQVLPGVYHLKKQAMMNF